MKTINISSNKDVKILKDENDNIIGFAGNVKLYDTYIYVDTRTGKGYDKVISKMDRYINKLSYKYNLSNLGFGYDDTRQHIIMRILEGIPKYNPSKETTLSTFLHMRIERRIINEVRNLSTDNKNPTVLKTSLYSVSCHCGRKFMSAVGGNENIRDRKCFGCNSSLNSAKILPVNVPPESIDSVFNIRSLANTERLNIDDVVSENSYDIPLVFGQKQELDDYITFKSDIIKWVEKEDLKTKQLIELVCFDDYSIKAAAEKLGMSHTGANNKLKSLKRKKIIRDTFGR